MFAEGGSELVVPLRVELERGDRGVSHGGDEHYGRHAS
jgi:hypothetical protein